MNSRLTIGLVVFITALTFYVATLAPTVEWGDFGGFQTRVSIGELELAPYGHPLWNLIARPFTWLPFGDSAFRVNLSSAFFASLTLLVLWFTLPALTQSRTASILAILALAISHTFWTYSVLPKAYTLTLFILALGLLLLLRWRESPRAWPIVAVGVLLGLGIMNHLVVATAVPGYTVFVLWHSRRRLGDMLRFAVGVAGGLAPYFYLLSTTPTKGSDTLTSVMSYVTKFAQLLATPPELLTGIAFTAANVAYQFLLLTPVALWGWWRMWRDDRSLAAALMMIFAGDVAFVLVPVAPPIMQNWHLFHPAHLALTYPLAYGLAAIAERLRYSRRSAAAQITTGLAAIVVPALLTYFILAPEAARAFHITDRLGLRDFPGRDTVSFLFIPAKAGDYSARRYAETALSALPNRAVLFADWTPYTAVWYLQAVEGWRPDVSLLELPVKESLAIATGHYRALGRPVFIADTSRYYDLASLDGHYRVEREGAVYELIPLP